MNVTSTFDHTAESYLKLVADYSMALIQQTTLDEVVWEISRYVSRALGFYDCIVYLYNEENKELVQKSAFGPKSSHPFRVKEPIILPLGVGIVGSVAATMEAEIVSDTSQDPRYVVDDEFRYSEITVPIVYEGRLLGVIDSEHPDKNFYTREQLEILKIIASMSATKIQQAMVFDHLQIQTEKLKISNNRLLQFAYIASHDLRSPVSNIVTLLSFFDEKKIDSENLLFFNNIKKASKKLQDNLHHLIEMVMDENNLYKRGEAINLCKLLDEVRFGIEKQLEESGAAIEVQFQVQSVIYPSVYLHSIIQNLITNAIKYRSPDRPPVIKVKTRKQGKFTCLSVEDNGRGIDLQKNRFKIFSRLERFDRDVEGKGIGLYLIKTQVEALGGKIEVESELGVGTKFHVYLSPEWKE